MHDKSGVGRPVNDGEDFWVFGYGSLMWRPGFRYIERQIATVRGYHRALCIYSHVHRGTPEAPGLVLGLDRGGSCKGVAFRVDGERRKETIEYLRERELVTLVYTERLVHLVLDSSGIPISALAYVVDRAHAQYAGKLSREISLQMILQGVGQSGENTEYVRNTHAHLVDLGIKDRDLDWYAARLTTASAEFGQASV